MTPGGDAIPSGTWRKLHPTFPAKCDDCGAVVQGGQDRFWNNRKGKDQAYVCVTCAGKVGLKEGYSGLYSDLKLKASGAAAPPPNQPPPAPKAAPAPSPAPPPPPASPSAQGASASTPLPKMSTPVPGIDDARQTEVSLTVKGGSVIAITQRDHVTTEVVAQMNYNGPGATLAKVTVGLSGFVPEPGETPAQTSARVERQVAFAKESINKAKAALDDVVASYINRPWKDGPIYR